MPSAICGYCENEIEDVKGASFVLTRRDIYTRDYFDSMDCLIGWASRQQEKRDAEAAARRVDR